MLHNIDPRLEIEYHDTALLNVRVNDLLTDESPSNTNNLTSNLVSIDNIKLNIHFLRRQMKRLKVCAKTTP